MVPSIETKQGDTTAAIMVRLTETPARYAVVSGAHCKSKDAAGAEDMNQAAHERNYPHLGPEEARLPVVHVAGITGDARNAFGAQVKPATVFQQPVKMTRADVAYVVADDGVWVTLDQAVTYVDMRT